MMPKLQYLPERPNQEPFTLPRRQQAPWKPSVAKTNVGQYSQDGTRWTWNCRIKIRRSTQWWSSCTILWRIRPSLSTLDRMTCVRRVSVIWLIRRVRTCHYRMLWIMPGIRISKLLQFIWGETQKRSLIWWDRDKREPTQRENFPRIWNLGKDLRENKIRKTKSEDHYLWEL